MIRYKWIMVIVVIVKNDRRIIEKRVNSYEDNAK